MKRSLIVLLVLGLSPMGCEKEPPPEPDEMAEPAPEPQSKPKSKSKKRKPNLPSLAPAEPKAEVEGPPTPPDFEEEADKSIHFENLEAELDRLEAEITGG